jgi:hypothetical protein
VSFDAVSTLLTFGHSLYHFGQVVWLWGVIQQPSQCLGLADYGKKIGSITTTTSYANAFNRNDSRIDSLSDSGNVSIGPAGAAESIVSQVLPLLVAAMALLGGLFLISKKA